MCYTDTPSRRNNEIIFSVVRYGFNNFVVFAYFLIYCGYGVPYKFPDKLN